MSLRTVASLARIVALAALVLVVTAGGSHLVSTRSQVIPTPAPTEVAQLTPTEAPIIDLTSTQTPTATTAPIPPTVIPTEVEVATPTEAAQTGRGTFPVPENTTGRSIVVERGPENSNTVALTFDAGEGAGYTSEILDMLKQYGLHGSFGVTGEWARENPDLVNRILDEGHLMFNHSESHLSWTGASPGTEMLTDQQRTEQVMGADQAVEDVAGWSMQPFWRPPYGDLDADGQTLLHTLGYDYTFWWTCDSLAWNGITADEIAARCASDTDLGGPGAIILMHVSQEQDYLALEKVISDYAAAGYEFVTLNLMIGD